MIPERLHLLIPLMALFLVTISCDAQKPVLQSKPGIIHHDLRVRIFPAEQRLSGTDDITVRAPNDDQISFFLSEKARVTEVIVDGAAVKAGQRAGQLVILLPSAQKNRDIKVTVRYDAVFDDPAPIMPVNTDNPGYGVTGTISARGVFLLGGAGWYPAAESPSASFRLEVTAPEGMVAVTAGKSLGIRTENGLTLSTWDIRRAAEPIALSAGPYEVREAAVGEITAATYLFPQSRHLSDEYLAAITRFIRFYQDLFGPYPFEKFAVVENFFPTGYGFPSYTLMGTQVLHLPFIKHTSLGHEIAHCWWGNGVGVDTARGNWCEGLTSYVSDYLYKEQVSDANGSDYRQQLLRNYAAIIRDDSDFPLSAFVGRTDPATKVIGYDKGAMVFHMLRREVGDDTFWAALRTLYKDYLFQAVSWTEIETVFEQAHGRSLKPFFDQWLDRPGAVQLAVEGVTSIRKNGVRHVTGTLRQTRPYYQVRVPVTVVTPTGETRSIVEMAGETAAFDVELPAGSDGPEDGGAPTKLIIDPDADVFRKLYPSEIPPSINSLKGSDGIVVVVAGNDPEETARAYLIIEALGLDSAKVIEEGRLTAGIIRENDLIFMSIPRDPRLLRGMPEAVAISRKTIDIGARTYPVESHAFFMVFRHPEYKNRVAALFFAPDDTADAVIRKIPHYGKYSYLVFRKAQNRDKGTWPVTASPLIHRF